MSLGKETKGPMKYNTTFRGHESRPFSNHFRISTIKVVTDILALAITKNNHNGVTVLTLSHDFSRSQPVSYLMEWRNSKSQHTAANDSGRNTVATIDRRLALRESACWV